MSKMNYFDYTWFVELSDDTKIPFHESADNVNNPLELIPDLNHSPVHYFMNAPFDRIGPGNGKIPPGLEHHPLANRFTKNGNRGWLIKKSDVISVFAIRREP